MDTQDFASEYSEPSFWEKCTGAAKAAGSSVLERGLWLFYAMPGSPPWAQATIAGALGYFISPIDVIPDFTPVVGYSDDLAVLLAAVAVLGSHIDQVVKDKTAEKMRDWGFAA